MATDNETHAKVIADITERAEFIAEEYDHNDEQYFSDWCGDLYEFASRAEAAHKREIESYKRLLRTSQCALEDEIVKNQEHRREIEKLRECLKDACSTELSCSECKSPCSEYTQDDCPIKKMWRKALKGERDA